MANRLSTATNYQYECLEGSGYVWSAESLAEINETAAARASFNQNDSYLVNHYEPGMKLESHDPRRINMDATCIATVIGTQGPRVRLRLDGSDSKNDFWRMIDSEDLHPIGTCESKDGLLQPPLGFTKQPIQWNNFRKKTLSNAKFADKSCFHKPPSPPHGNTFIKRQKLEAVDRKNPQLICPATVGDIRGEEIYVCFDGWRGAFDYWCKYSDRDIFPVGWTSLNDHPLQHPGVVFQPVKRSKSTPATTVKFDINANASPSPKIANAAEGRQLCKNKTFHIHKSASISHQVKPDINCTTNAVSKLHTPNYKRYLDNSYDIVKMAKIPRINAKIAFKCQIHKPLDASNWDSNQVVEFVQQLDESLSIYVDKFKDMEIDGSTFMCMDSNQLRKYLSLKLGPALKFADIAKKLRTGRFMNDMLKTDKSTSS